MSFPVRKTHKNFHAYIMLTYIFANLSSFILIQSFLEFTKFQENSKSIHFFHLYFLFSRASMFFLTILKITSCFNFQVSLQISKSHDQILQVFLLEAGYRMWQLCALTPELGYVIWKEAHICDSAQLQYLHMFRECYTEPRIQ